MTRRLADDTLPAVASRGVVVPTYDRTALAPRILHVGVGGFHRSHMALYTDELATAGGDWGICGIGLLEADRRMAAALVAQDHLYTLIERDGDSSTVRIVGSIIDYRLVVEDLPGFAGALADDGVEILSMTITEGGYSTADTNPTLEAIATALDARRTRGGRPLTILSCDNLPGNGNVARAAISSVCARRSRDLARYVDESCSFPNSMVDRITPQTTDDDRRWLRDQIGIDDPVPVVSEAFRQWVIEDDFAAARPPYDDVGVLVTDRVHDWELYKLRMLNASHSCMAYLMALAGVAYVDEAMAIPAVRDYLERFLADEAIPTLTEIPGHPPAEYARTALDRFDNTGVRDQIARLCIDGTAKFPTFLIPTIERQLELGGPLERGALALAAWARYLATTPPARRARDPQGDRAAAFATRSADPTTFLDFGDVFTPSLRASSRFVAAYSSAAKELEQHGALGVLERWAA